MDYSINGVGITDYPSTGVSEGLSRWYFPLCTRDTEVMVASEPYDDQMGAQVDSG